MSYTAVIHHLTGTSRLKGYKTALAAANAVFAEGYDTYNAEIVKTRHMREDKDDVYDFFEGSFDDEEVIETIITMKQFDGLLKKIEQSKKKLIKEMVGK